MKSIMDYVIYLPVKLPDKGSDLITFEHTRKAGKSYAWRACFWTFPGVWCPDVYYLWVL